MAPERMQVAHTFCPEERTMGAMSRRQIEATVWDLASELAQEQGLELVDVEYVKEYKDYHLRIFIDKPAGVGLDDCQQFSEAFSERLDEVDPIPGPYLLEVSSPGLDRPLKKLSDYDRFSGETVRIRTYGPIDGRRNWQGILVGRSGEHIELDVEGVRVVLPFEKIARARLVPKFS